jgi:hypothetical protein
VPSWNCNSTLRLVNSTTKDFYHALDSNTTPLTDRRPQALANCGAQARTSANQCRWACCCNCDFVNTWQNGNTITRKLTYETSGLCTNKISLAHGALQGKFPPRDGGSSSVEWNVSLIAPMRGSNMHDAFVRGTSYGRLVVEISVFRADSNRVVICAPMI